MIDLNLKPKEEKDTPVGVQILMFMPLFILLFAAFVRVL